MLNGDDIKGVIDAHADDLLSIDQRQEVAALIVATMNSAPKLSDELWEVLESTLVVGEPRDLTPERLPRKRRLYELAAYIVANVSDPPAGASMWIASCGEVHPGWREDEAADLTMEAGKGRLLRALQGDVSQVTTWLPEQAVGYVVSGEDDKAFEVRGNLEAIGWRAATDVEWGASVFELLVLQANRLSSEQISPVLWGIRTALADDKTDVDKQRVVALLKTVVQLRSIQSLGKPGLLFALPAILKDLVELDDLHRDELLEIGLILLESRHAIADIVSHEEPREDRDWLQEAINHPVGHIVEMFLGVLRRDFRSASVNNVSVEMDPMVERGVGRLLEDDQPSSLFGIVLLGHAFAWLEAVFGKWTETHLYPLLYWESGEARGLAVWAGYLWQGTIGRRVGEEFGRGYLGILERRAELSNNEREGLVRHLGGLIWFDLVEEGERWSIIRVLRRDERIHLVRGWGRNLESASRDRADDFIAKVVIPYWQWLLIGKSLCGEEAGKEAFALWELVAIGGGETSTLARLAVQSPPRQAEDLHGVLEKLERSELLQKDPSLFLELLTVLLRAQRNPSWNADEWRQLWQRLKGAEVPGRERFLDELTRFGLIE